MWQSVESFLLFVVVCASVLEACLLQRTDRDHWMAKLNHVRSSCQFQLPQPLRPFSPVSTANHENPVGRVREAGALVPVRMNQFTSGIQLWLCRKYHSYVVPQWGREGWSLPYSLDTAAWP